MIDRTQTFRRFFATLTAASLLCGALASAAESTAKPAAPSTETREKMAKAHEKMAACLRSDRAIADCRTEMMQACHDMMDEQGCGMGMMGPGKRHPAADHGSKTQ